MQKQHRGPIHSKNSTSPSCNVLHNSAVRYPNQKVDIVKYRCTRLDFPPISPAFAHSHFSYRVFLCGVECSLLGFRWELLLGRTLLLSGKPLLTLFAPVCVDTLANGRGLCVVLSIPKMAFPQHGFPSPFSFPSCLPLLLSFSLSLAVSSTDQGKGGGEVV